MAEIEHFVDPEDKSHPKYAEVADLEFFMFPREEQMSGQSAKRICLGEAVSKVNFNNSVVVSAFFLSNNCCLFSIKPHAMIILIFFSFRVLSIMRLLVISLGEYISS